MGALETAGRRGARTPARRDAQAQGRSTTGEETQRSGPSGAMQGQKGHSKFGGRGNPSPNGWLLPTGWQAVVLSLSMTLSLMFVPPLCRAVFGIIIIESGHYQAMLVVVVTSALDIFFFTERTRGRLRQRDGKPGFFHLEHGGIGISGMRLHLGSLHIYRFHLWVIYAPFDDNGDT